MNHMTTCTKCHIGSNALWEGHGYLLWWTLPLVTQLDFSIWYWGHPAKWWYACIIPLKSQAPLTFTLTLFCNCYQQKTAIINIYFSTADFGNLQCWSNSCGTADDSSNLILNPSSKMMTCLHHQVKVNHRLTSPSLWHHSALNCQQQKTAIMNINFSAVDFKNLKCWPNLCGTAENS